MFHLDETRLGRRRSAFVTRLGRVLKIINLDAAEMEVKGSLALGVFRVLVFKTAAYFK